jgi:hypothetical protein
MVLPSIPYRLLLVSQTHHFPSSSRKGSSDSQSFTKRFPF